MVVEKDKEVELQIILGGDMVVRHGSSSKEIKISSLGDNKLTDLKNHPICHSHAHS